MLEAAPFMGRYTEKSARTSLQRLCEQGVVLKGQKGSAGLYSLNRGHLAAPYILRLANLKHELFERMTKAITGWEVKPVFAARVFELSESEVVQGLATRRKHRTSVTDDRKRAGRAATALVEEAMKY